MTDDKSNPSAAPSTQDSRKPQFFRRRVDRARTLRSIPMRPLPRLTFVAAFFGIIIATVLLLSHPGPTHAAGDKLVSNLDQPTNSDTGSAANDHAQAFITGGNSLGYPLKAITLDVGTAPGSGTLRVRIRATTGASGSYEGHPGSLLYTLSNPSNVGTGHQTFTAPSNAHLDPNTQYWVHTSFTGEDQPQWNITYHVTEDAGAYPGWSIVNERRYRALGSTGSWSTHVRPMMIRVLTTVAPVYVRNTGKANSSDLAGLDSKDQAQGFDTGGNALGYHLGRIEFDLERAPGSGDMTVTVRPSNGSGDPSTSVLYTLTSFDTVGTGLQQFYAPDGARLQPNTDYFVHVSYDDSGTTPRLRTTSATSEDSGAYSGWNIGNDRREYENGSWSSPSNTIKIKIMAPNVPLPAPAAPTDLSAELGDGEVTLTWTDPDDPTIFKYQYSTNGGTSFSDISGSSATTAAYTVTGLTNGTEYTLAVRGVNATDYGTASTVDAAPEIVYVSNMDKATNTSTGSYSETTRYAQRFTTGWGPLGFYLGSIELDFRRAPGNGTLEVTVRTVGNAGRPSGTALYTLDNPSNVGTGLHRFMAPYGAYLDALTDYFVVLKYTGGGTDPRLERTSSDGEDAGAYQGWSIQNDHFTASDTSNWAPLNLAVKIKVKGADVIPPRPAPPTNLTATPGSQQVAVTWDHPGDISIRKYQYSTDGGSTFNDMNGSNKDTTSFTFRNLITGVNYTMAIRASNLSGNGEAATVTGTPAVVLPDAPTGLSSAPGYGQVTLSWDDPDDITIEKYQLMRLLAESKLAATDGANGEEFGYSVAVDGNVAVVGARKDTGFTGAAYIFTKDSGADSWTQQAKLTASNISAGAQLGQSVDIDDDTVLVGAFADDGRTGSAFVFVKPALGWTDATETQKLTASDGGGDDEFGSSVAVDGDTVVIGAPGDNHVDGNSTLNDAGSAYVFTRNGSGVWNQAANLTASDPSLDDNFGDSVAVEGDTVVAGSSENQPFGSDDKTGSAYIFIKPAGGWADGNETALLTASDGEDGDLFGDSVAVDGDTVVVGAYREGLSSGSAYVFTKPAGSWVDGTETGKLTASDRASTDNLGRSVAVDGDTVVVGAPGESNDAGAIYIFTKPATGWDDVDEVTKITASDGADDDEFGWAVAVDGNTVMAGAEGGAGNTPTSGAAYILDLENNGWTDISGSGATTISHTVTGLTTGVNYTMAIRAVNLSGNGEAVTVTGTPALPDAPTGLSSAPGDGQLTLSWDDPGNITIEKYQLMRLLAENKLAATDGANGDEFGYSVAVDGNVAVVGAPKATGFTGAAYIFTKDSGADTWTQQAKLTPSDASSNDWFGDSVAVDEDTVVVGARRDDDNGNGSGSAYVFIKPADGWTTTTSFAAKLTPSDGAPGDRFGVSVAVDGDTVVAGASGDDDKGSNSGSAYVFTKPADGWTTTSSFAAKLTASDGAAEDAFGWVVAVDEDTAVVGAYGDDDNGDESGSAYMFTKPADGWTTTSSFAARLTAPDGAAGDEFGYSVAVDGDMVVVGAYTDHDNGPNSGSAYVFTKPATGWTSTSTAAKLTASDGGSHDEFGKSVAVDGDTVVVGTPGESDRTGAIYIFTKPATGWDDVNEVTKITGSDGGQDDQFGRSVAVDDNTIVAGAPNSFSIAANPGAAHILDLGNNGWADISGSGATTTSHTVTGLTNGVHYTMAIRAVDLFGNNGEAATVTGTPSS